MTETDAFKEAMELIKKQVMQNWWTNDPVKAFITPQKVIWMWIRIDDYFIVNQKYPKSYRSLHAWEKKYYENNM